MEKYRVPLGTHPNDENLRVVNILNSTNIGLTGTHLVKTSAQEFNERAHKKMGKVKLQKEQTRLGKTVDSSAAPKRAQTANDADNLKRTQKKSAQEEIDKAIREQNSRDHLFEMKKGTDALNKQPTSSHYDEQYVFDRPMQELCDHTNFEHHQLKNDLKWYTEAYVKYKVTMRK